MSDARVWPALERHRFGAVLADWRRSAGEALALIKPWLRLLPRLAASYPVWDAFDYCRRLDVVEHGPDDFVGVDDEGESVAIARTELLLYGLDFERLADDVAKAFGLERSFGEPDAANPLRIGAVRSGAARASAWLALADEPMELTEAIVGWLSSAPKRGVLFTLTPDCWSDGVQALVEQKGTTLVALSDCVSFTPVGGLAARFDWSDLLGDAAEQAANVFQLRNGSWRLVFDGLERHVADDMLGLHYIRRLLQSPNVPVAAERLRLEQSSPAAASAASRQEILDSEAISRAGRRLTEIAEERRKASATNDRTLLNGLDEESDQISRLLERDTGIGGRAREMRGGKPRLEKPVVNAVNRAIKAVHGAHPALGRHLQNSIRTGRSCLYRPEVDPDWRL